MAYIKNNPLWFFQIKIVVIFVSATIISNHDEANAAALYSESILNNVTTDGSENSEKIECSSQICAAEVNFFQRMMDETVDPCDDFYKFVCGKYMANATLPEDTGEALMIMDVQTQIDNAIKSELNNYKEDDPSYFKKLKKFYNGCQQNVTLKRVSELLQILNTAGGVPVFLGEQWNETAFDWMETVSKLKRLGFTVNFPVDAKIELDLWEKVGKRYVGKRKIFIELPNREFFEPLVNYEEKEELLNETLKKHYQHIVNFAVQFGINRTVALAEMEAVSLFERSLLRIHVSEMLENPNGYLYSSPIKYLNREYSAIPWLNFFKSIATGVDIDENENIMTQSSRSLYNLTKLIRETPKKVISNYIMMQAIAHVQKHLPNEFLQRDSSPNRLKMCWDETRYYFGRGLSALYVQKFVKRGARESAVSLAENVKSELKKILQSNNWMDNSTKSRALEKLEAMWFTMGYPDEYLDNEKLNQYYSNFEVNNTSFLKTFLNANKHYSAIYAAMLKKPVIKSDWTQLLNVHAEEINSYYHLVFNSIDVAAASLGEPLFEATRPQYLNYGMLGTILGHEMSHGFGDIGQAFDKTGNLSDWWSSNTNKNFAEKKQCLIEQYNNYTVQPFGIHLRGDLGLEENFADNFGLKTAYYAYTQWTNRNNITEPLLPGLNYNPRQMFWINAASFYCAKYKPETYRKNIMENPHSPEEARVRVAFSNLQEFADDFKCAPGTKMNPVNKCDLW